MSQCGSWALCYDWRTDCTSCAATSSLSHLCSCSSSEVNFHSACDPHTETLVIGHNGLDYTIGGFAPVSWQAASDSPGYDWAPSGNSSFLFRLAGPGGVPPKLYLPTGMNAHYQRRSSDNWPTWGSGYDLCFGTAMSLGGNNAYCHNGETYEDDQSELCGGSGWAAAGTTSMEVWYRVGA